MKRILALLLCASLSLSFLSGCTAFSPSTVKELTAQKVYAVNYDGSPELTERVDAALSAFGLELLRDTRATQEGSVLLSPLSVALALSMAANGAEGETLAQFEDLLSGGSGLDVLNARCAQLMEEFQSLGGSTTCSIANSIWVDPDGQIREDFVGKCAGIFDAQVFQGDLSAPGIVGDLNGWVSEHTNKMIPNIISRPFEENTAALLVNALYLKNTWASKFDPNSTYAWEFTYADDSVKSMDFLSKGSSTLPYLQGDGVQGVVLPYDDGRLGFFALLPEEDLDSWLAGLGGDDLSRLLAGREDTSFLRLALPKFEAEWKGELKDILSALGLEDAFAPGVADFSLLGDNPEGYYLSQVIHAVKIKVNEKGTEAAAATVGAGSGESGAPLEEGITLIFDRPFLYGIVDLETGLPLFLGTFE